MVPPATKARKIEPLQTMHPRDQSAGIRCVAHLPGRRRIITCSEDGSLRQWNLENGAQVGNDWRDEGDDDGVYTIALSPKGNTIAAGSGDGTVKLWDVEVGKVVAKSKGHAFTVWTICWSADGEGVVSGSTDGTAGLWDVEPSGKIVLDQLIKTGHEYVYAVIYSPDMTMVATGGYNENGVKIWDVRTGGLLSTIQHEETVFSLAWTSDQKKLISGTENGLIRIFDTTAWQELAILEGHQSTVYAISLFRNNRLLASASWDETARLWNLDTNLPVGLPLQHEDTVNGVAISADGKLLVTGCEDSITQAWDVHDILKDAGLEDLLFTPDKVAAGKPSMNTDATTRHPAQLDNTHRLPRDFFDDTRDGVHSSAVRGTHSRSTVRRRRAPARSSTSRPYAFLSRLSSLVHRSQATTDQSTELQQRQRQSITSHHSPQIVEVAAVRDKEALFVARRPERVRDMVKRIKNPTRWTRIILFICCVSLPDTNDPQS